MGLLDSLGTASHLVCVSCFLLRLTQANMQQILSLGIRHKVLSKSSRPCVVSTHFSDLTWFPLVPSLSVALFTGVFLLLQPFLLLPFPGQLLFLCQVVSQAPPPPSLVWPETAPPCSSHIPASSPYTILVRNHFCACVPGQSGQGPCLSVVELSLSTIWQAFNGPMDGATYECTNIREKYKSRGLCSCTHVLCDFVQVTSLLWASGSLSICTLRVDFNDLYLPFCLKILHSLRKAEGNALGRKDGEMQTFSTALCLTRSPFCHHLQVHWLLQSCRLAGPYTR